MINNLFDVGMDNIAMVKVDDYEATQPEQCERKYIALATEKQLAFLKKLFLERSNNEEAMILRTHLLGEYKAGNFTRFMASQAIEDVLKMEKNAPAEQVQTPITSLDHGQIWVDNNGNFVKICLNQAGTAFYGKIWDPESESWVFTRGAISNISHKVTAEEAKAFSEQWESEHRFCIFCMKHLSDPRSESAGYGQTCAEKHDLPWG